MVILFLNPDQDVNPVVLYHFCNTSTPSGFFICSVKSLIIGLLEEKCLLNKLHVHGC